MTLKEYRKYEVVLILVITITLLYVGFLIGIGLTLENPQKMYDHFIKKGKTYIVLPEEKAGK